MDAPFRKGVFVSYSHRDSAWLEKLRVHLAPHMRGERLDLWDDNRIAAGSDWRKEIAQAISNARVAVLLVSPDFLASDFVADVELPQIRAQLDSGLTLLWVAVRHSAYDITVLEQRQAANDPRVPLDALPPPEQDRVLVEVARRIASAADVNALANSLRLIDEFTPQVQAFVDGTPEPTGPVQHRVMSEQRDEAVLLREGGGNTLEVITAGDMEALDPNARMLIRAFERTMQDLFERWVMLKPRRTAADDAIRQAACTESDTIKRDLCAELTGLLNFIESLGKSLYDHYHHVRFICQ